MVVSFVVRLRIEYEREGCIGAYACYSLDPARWKLAEGENKVDLIGGQKRADGKYELAVDVSEEEKTTIVTAAQSCPPQIIKVFEMDTGKQLA
jgi:ferredoxin